MLAEQSAAPQLDRDTRRLDAGATGAADAVQIVLRDVGQLEVDDVREGIMSRPRAATSVATRMATRPLLKSVSARLRCGWLLSPWMAVALMPSRSSCRAAGRHVLGAGEDERLLDPA